MMIDIHCHILPAMDDGAPDFEATRGMLSIAGEDGITAMVATPHSDLRYRYDPERCAHDRARIALECPGAPTVYAGCELHLTPENLEAVLLRPQLFTINGRNCLLLELPNPVIPTVVESAVQILTDAGICPVIAHPERNYLFHRNLRCAEGLNQLGAFFQVTAQSITGSFGPDAQRTSISLLKRNLVHVIATDAHGIEHRRPLLSPARAEVARQFGDATADLLFVENPRACITGQPLRSAQPKKSFFAFLRRSDEYSVPSIDVS